MEDFIFARRLNEAVAVEPERSDGDKRELADCTALFVIDRARGSVVCCAAQQWAGDDLNFRFGGNHVIALYTVKPIYSSDAPIIWKFLDSWNCFSHDCYSVAFSDVEYKLAMSSTIYRWNCQQV